MEPQFGHRPLDSLSVMLHLRFRECNSTQPGFRTGLFTGRPPRFVPIEFHRGADTPPTAKGDDYPRL
jgi:hypothetical protein